MSSQRAKPTLISFRSGAGGAACLRSEVVWVVRAAYALCLLEKMTFMRWNRLVCCLLGAFASLARGRQGPFLSVYGAGMMVGDAAPVLRDGDSFCVNAQPFTVFCMGMRAVKSVLWTYRGRDIAVGVVPRFSIAGERNGVPRPWKGFKGPGKLRCSASNGESVEVFLKAPCDDAVPRGAGGNASTLPGESPRPSVAPPVASEAAVGNFILFNASAYVSPAEKLPDGWKAVKDSLIFRQGGGGWVAPAPEKDSFSLVYSFVAPGNLTYALAMDSTPGPSNATVRSRTEHNDVYVRLRKPGFTRRRLKVVGEDLEEKTKKSTTAWLKVYQNQAARSWQAATTDNLPDYLSTSSPLIKGNEYVLEVAGRSTDFSLHGFCLFPCNGLRCSRQTVFWREQEKLCSMLRDA